MKRLHTEIILLLCVVIIFGACSAPMSPEPPPRDGGGGTSAPAQPVPGDDSPVISGRPREFVDDYEFWEMVAREDWLDPADTETLFEIWAALRQDTGPYFSMPIITPGDESGRMLIYDVRMRLQTSEMMSGWRLMHNTAGRLDGEIEHAIFYGRDKRQVNPENMRAFFALRIPTENLAEFIELVENNYNIWWLEMRVQDETVTYQRRDASLEGLRNEETQLIDALENETAPEQEQALQDQLATIRRQLDDLQIAQDQLVRDVIYSTVTVELFEAFLPTDEETVHLTHAERLNQTTSAIVQGTLVFATTALPVMLVILILVAIVLVIIRFVNKLRRSDKLIKFLNGEQPHDQDPDE